MKYQNKGDNNWQLTSNNYACWHNTFFSFCFILPIMHLFWKYRTGIAVRASVCVAWSAGQKRTDHACLSALCLCAYCCACSFYPLSLASACISVSHASPIPQQANWASTKGGISLIKVSLSTAIKIFFRGISSCVTVFYLLFKVIKRVCRYPL